MPLGVAIDDIDPLSKILKTSALGQTLSDYDIPDYALKHAEDSDIAYANSITHLKNISTKDYISFDDCRHSLKVVLRHCRTGSLAKIIKVQISFILQKDQLKKNNKPAELENTTLKIIIQNIVTAYKNSSNIYSISGDNTDSIQEVDMISKPSQSKQEHIKREVKERPKNAIDNSIIRTGSTALNRNTDTRILLIDDIDSSIKITRSQLPKGVGDLVKINKEISSDYICKYKEASDLRIVSMYEQIETKAKEIINSNKVKARNDVRKLKEVVDILTRNNDELKQLNNIDKFTSGINSKIANRNWIKLVNKYFYTYEIICIYNLCVLNGITSSPSKKSTQSNKYDERKIQQPKSEMTKREKVLSIDKHLEDLIDENNLELLSYKDWKTVSLIYKEVRALWKFGGKRVKFSTLPTLVWKLFSNENEYKKFKKNYSQLSKH